MCHITSVSFEDLLLLHVESVKPGTFGRIGLQAFTNGQGQTRG